jgi:hypothetical protein
VTGLDGLVPVETALPAGTPPESGFLLRTDHVALRTDLSWREGVRLARLAEAHVLFLIEAYGESLDLRLPNAPLAVVAAARRAEFDARLRQHVSDPVGWGAFYESGSGTVYVSKEPAAKGPLPPEADLRHEMTHQVLDLATPAVDRRPIFEGCCFWLWEGVAVHAEGLGDPPGRGADALRFERFGRRLAARDWTTLDRLFALPQRDFEGRHYDQTASLMRFLMADGIPGSRDALLATLRDMLRGRPVAGSFERRLGRSPREIEAAWIVSLGGRAGTRRRPPR